MAASAVSDLLVLALLSAEGAVHRVAFVIAGNNCITAVGSVALGRDNPATGSGEAEMRRGQ
ncbi:hypothetical protein B6E78_04875 [Edwardsiella ictaluri]|nr:hypothetical protein B6E78_04875 [Edwardsiella ictaluri]